MTAVSILKTFGLSITKSRINLLTAFLEIDSPFTITILNRKNLDFNRITLHRVLKAFVEKGILHIIPSSDNRIFYKINVPLTKPDELHEGHPHYICSNCRSTLCIETKPLLEIKLPPDYKMKSIEIVINGKSDHCA